MQSKFPQNYKIINTYTDKRVYSFNDDELPIVLIVEYKRQYCSLSKIKKYSLMILKDDDLLIFRTLNMDKPLDQYMYCDDEGINNQDKNYFKKYFLSDKRLLELFNLSKTDSSIIQTINMFIELIINTYPYCGIYEESSQQKWIGFVKFWKSQPKDAISKEIGILDYPVDEDDKCGQKEQEECELRF